ncbi:hypothetical protein JXL19_10460 [bacterium]|nr:hypothetical protein [bacterium]
MDNVADALKTMRERGYWIHDNIVNVALKEIGEI